MKLPKVAARIQELREAEQKAREADRRVARTRDVILSRLSNIGADMEPVTICGSDGAPAGIFLPLCSLGKAILSN